MMNLFFTLLMVVTLTISCGAMQIAQSIPASKTSVEPMVTLISTEGKKYTLPVERIEPIESLKQMFSEKEFKALEEFPVNIDAESLEMIVMSLNLIASHREKKTQLEKLNEGLVHFKQLPLDTQIKFLLEVHRLGFEILEGFIFRHLAEQIRVIPSKFNEINYEFSKYEHAGSAIPHWKQKIAQKYYLITGKDLEGVDPKSYGFSVQELVDNNRIDLTIKQGRYGKTLDLSKSKINNLNGLESLRGLEEVTQLNISNNLITKLPVSAFKSLPKLIYINRENNPIEGYELYYGESSQAADKYKFFIE